MGVSWKPRHPVRQRRYQRIIAELAAITEGITGLRRSAASQAAQLAAARKQITELARTTNANLGEVMTEQQNLDAVGQRIEADDEKLNAGVQTIKTLIATLAQSHPDLDFGEVNAELDKLDTTTAAVTDAGNPPAPSPEPAPEPSPAPDAPPASS